MSGPDTSFATIADGGASLAAVLDAAQLADFHPTAREPGLSRWDAIQQGSDLKMNQSDCAWFAFEAAAEGRRFSGILALHRTGPRFARMRLGPEPVQGAPPLLRPLLAGPLAPLILVKPVFDARPLFLAVLYDHQRGEAECFEQPVEGEIDPHSFSFRSPDLQLLQGAAAAWRPSLPPILQAFFARDLPAFALRARNRRFELELFLRPHKDPVLYGDGPALRSGKTVIHYVQRSRLDLIGRLQLDSGPPLVLRGDATQDRHWTTVRQIGLRWIWFMARLDDGRECMAYELRGAGGGRRAPADSGPRLGGGAWLVGVDGSVRAVDGWSLTPEAHQATPRGPVPRRLRVELPGELRLVVESEMPTFVPTRALGELAEAGIWESPARLVEGSVGGRFWMDVMPPYGGV